MTTPRCIAIVVRNPVTHDARVIRSAQALRDAGYDVTVVGLLRDGMAAEEFRDGLRIVRVGSAGVALRILDAIIIGPNRLAHRARRRHAWFVRRGRRIVARVRLQWWHLRERGTAVGAIRTWTASLRAPRSAAVSTVLLPAALVRSFLGPAPGPEPDLTPGPIPRSRIVSLLWALERLVRTIFIGPRRAAFAWGFQLEAARAMARVKPCVYHCNDIHTIWTGFRASRIHRAPVIYDAHEIYAHQNMVRRTLRRRALVATTEWVALRRCAGSITVNDSLADWYAKRYRVARPTVVRNIPDPRVAAGDVAVPPALLSGRPTLLYIGGITTGRGLAASIESLVHLPGVDLALLGPVNAERTLRAFTDLIERLGLQERVHFLGAVPPEAVSAIAAHATVGLALIENVCLSYYYSLPNKLFECIHAGLPVVASDFPEIARIVSAYDLGVLCDPVDPKAIAAAAATLIEDQALYARAVAGAARAGAELRWEFEAERLLELYARVTA